jgi:hypothetical protein
VLSVSKTITFGVSAVSKMISDPLRPLIVPWILVWPNAIVLDSAANVNNRTVMDVSFDIFRRAILAVLLLGDQRTSFVRPDPARLLSRRNPDILGVRDVPLLSRLQL